jgi:hypothetical protein
MHQFGQAKPRRAHSRASTVEESPPQKRPRITHNEAVDIIDVDAAPDTSAQESATKSVVMSQGSDYDQIFFDVEAQSTPIDTEDAATSRNVHK